MENNQESNPSSIIPEPLLSVKEIAFQLHISRSFAYLLMESGQIPIIRLGRSCRVKQKDLAAFIERNTHCQADYP